MLFQEHSFTWTPKRWVPETVSKKGKRIPGYWTGGVGATEWA